MLRQLTNEQKTVAFEKSGLFVVKACPGSGKTLIVAARVHKLLSEWRHPHAGVAAISFTNVAWREIQDYLVSDLGVPVPLRYPHFLGTIDSFINQFIFLPFGHRVMNCDSRPELRGPPHNDLEPIDSWMYWNNGECKRNGCKLNDFSYGEDGSLIHLAPKSHFNRCENGHSRCSDLKRRFTKVGYATQADANYFGMRVLVEYPEVAKSLARRFPVIIVDEAQDTSRIQMRILDALINAGVGEVMLVGDPDQAIYEWRQAKPRLFEEKFDAWRDNCTRLTENWRSTQSICDLACRLACSPDPMAARNEDLVAFDHEPQLYGYDSDTDLPSVLEDFRKHCNGLFIEPSSVSVLTRSKRFVNSIIPGAVPENRPFPSPEDDALTRQVAHAKYIFDQGDFKKSMKMLERAVYRHLTHDPPCSRDDVTRYIESWGLGNWKGELFRLLSMLPESKGRLSDWISPASSAIAQSSMLASGALAIKRDRGQNRYSEWTFGDVFTGPADPEETQNVIEGTVHSAKGRSLDAVFLVLKSKATGPQYVNLLGRDLTDQEELRIVYVAVTRARKALGIAVPNSALARWREFLFPQTDTERT